ncbi:MAG: hypothetical protein SHS37scaffold537_33 [Phage 68_12]|nr:MAG: hypothetical protein SHS37scaffold537_33 [Phage 68_12]
MRTIIGLVCLVPLAAGALAFAVWHIADLIGAVLHEPSRRRAQDAAILLGLYVAFALVVGAMWGLS